MLCPFLFFYSLTALQLYTSQLLQLPVPCLGPTPPLNPLLTLLQEWSFSNTHLIIFLPYWRCASHHNFFNMPLRSLPISWDPLIMTCWWFPPSSLSLPCLTHAVSSTWIPFFTWLTLTHPLDPGQAPSTTYLVRILQTHNLDSMPRPPPPHPQAVRASSAFLSPSPEVTSYNIGSFYWRVCF